MARSTPSRGRRTKAETDKEFSSVVDEVSEQAASRDPKLDEAAKARNTELRTAVEGLSVETVIKGISELSVNVTRALAELSTKMVAEVERLGAAREAVTLETQELERLHKIDVAATAIDQMVRDYQTQKAELEAEVTTQRAAWTEEQETRAREQKEFEDTLKKQRQRELDDYDYKKTQERKKASDKYEEEQRQLAKQNQDKQETLEKDWQQREASLREREEELAHLRREVEEFPARLKNQVDTAVAQAVKETQQRINQDMVLLRKDSEAERRLAEQQLAALKDALVRQTAEIEKLRQQTDDAKEQVQVIALKAIEGASGATALSHVNQIAIEQAKTRTTQS